MRHLGVFVIFQVMFIMFVTMLCMCSGSMRVAVGTLFSFGGGLIGIGAISLASTTQVPGPCAKDNHRKCEERCK